MAVRAPKPRSRSRNGKRPESSGAELATYRGKRNFRETSEPSGRVARSKQARYVIQKHAASRLHYDFRLEVDGVLKSWAVPKEIPVRAGGKALAVMVEDHPIEYGKFEGTIPKGQYGGGTVMLWDRGTYKAEGDDPATALAAGKIHFHLRGKKLRGEWALVKMRGEQNQWLLIKAGETMRPSGKSWDVSAETAQTMEEIAANHGSLTARKITEPAFVEPMKAKPSARIPTGKEWLLELKFDGYRFLATKGGDTVHLWSRTQKDFAPLFPQIADAVRALSCDTAILDGELVVPDDQGRPSFQLIQNADESTAVQGFVFDLLHLDGDDLRPLPLDARREQLAALIKDRPPLYFSTELTGDPAAVLAEIGRRSLEGIVAKRRSSHYEPGRRSGAWVKVKCLKEQEFVIGGFTPPKGSRECFGALLIGYYRGRKLVFAGKVGTGFDSRRLRSLHQAMSALPMAQCPFVDLPRPRSSRWSQPLTRTEMAHCTWVRPRLVCQVRFAEWTDDGILRQPAFLGMRDDKLAKEVTRES